MGSGVGAFWSNDDIPRMCFNAPKSWQIGWYSDRHTTVNTVLSGRWEGKLVGIDDYLNGQIPVTSDEHHVIVKIEHPSITNSIFMSYNRKEGVTNDVPEDYDKVVIYTQGTGYSASSNIAKLASGESYTKYNYDGTTDLIIKVCATESGIPDYADVFVCLDNGESDCTCSGTNVPTLTPIPCVGSPFKLVLGTDSYGSETEWQLEKLGTLIANGSGYSSSTEYEIDEDCLNYGDYTFTIIDSYGDGICCSYGTGYYKIFVDGEMIKEGGQFGDKEEFTFNVISNTPTVTSPSTTPNPPSTQSPSTQSPINPSTQSPIPQSPINPPTQSPTTSPTRSATPLPTPSPSTLPTKSATNPPTPSPSATSTLSSSTNGTSSGTDSSLKLVFFNDFESPNDWGNFTSGGGNSLRHIENLAHSGNVWSGDASLSILSDGLGSSSFITSNVINVVNYDELVVRFIYKSVSEDRCEGFALEYKTNLDADWTVQNEWYLHEDFVNGKWKVGMQVIPIENDDASMEFRFVNLDSNATMLFIDDVSVYGK